MLTCAINLTSSASLQGLDEMDLKRIADAVEAYQATIETLEIRTSSRFVNDPPSKKTDPTVWGPDVVMYQEYGTDSGTMEYCRTLVDRGNGVVTVDEEDYKRGELAFSVLRSNLDPSIVHEVHISRNFRDKASGVGRPMEILMGLVALDGRPLHSVLKDASSMLVGRKKVNGRSCFVVETVCLGNRALYYLDPSHDLLACKIEHIDPNGSVGYLWSVESFRQVDSCWFPEKVVRSFSTRTNEREVRRSCHTELEYVRINQAIPSKAFDFITPDGAKVTDDTKAKPVEYVQGGDQARKRLLKRLEDLEAAKKNDSKEVKGVEPRGMPVVVEAPFQWGFATPAVLATVSGVLLIAGAWLRLRRG